MRALALLFACSLLPAVELTVLDDGSAAQLTTLGNMELGQGRYETAIGHFTKALQVDRGYFWAIYNTGLAYQQMGRFDEAGQWYQRALTQSPDHPEVLCNLGWLAWRAGRFQEAADRFQVAARLAHDNPVDAAQYWTNVGTAREGLQQWEPASRAYQEALSLDGTNYTAHYNLGTLHLSHLNALPGALERAEAHLRAAVELAPERPAAWLNLAQCDELSGKSDPRISYDKALEGATGPYAAMRNDVRWQRALWFDRAVPPQKIAMREELKQILAAAADYPRANGLLGGYYYAIGDFEKATYHLEREVVPGHDQLGDPIDLECHYLLAVIYADHRPDPAKAIAHATAYYQQRPDAPKIHELRRRALRLSAAVTAGAGSEQTVGAGRETAGAGSGERGAGSETTGAGSGERGAGRPATATAPDGSAHGGTAHTTGEHAAPRSPLPAPAVRTESAHGSTAHTTGEHAAPRSPLPAPAAHGGGLPAPAAHGGGH